jgi:hypothetical protein
LNALDHARNRFPRILGVVFMFCETFAKLAALPKACQGYFGADWLDSLRESNSTALSQAHSEDSGRRRRFFWSQPFPQNFFSKFHHEIFSMVACIGVGIRVRSARSSVTRYAGTKRTFRPLSGGCRNFWLLVHRAALPPDADVNSAAAATQAFR